MADAAPCLHAGVGNAEAVADAEAHCLHTGVGDTGAVVGAGDSGDVSPAEPEEDLQSQEVDQWAGENTFKASARTETLVDLAVAVELVDVSESNLFEAAVDIRGFLARAQSSGFRAQERWADLLGESFPEWRGKPLEAQLLSLVKRCHDLRRPCSDAGCQRVQMIEYWAGSGNLTRAHIDIGLRCMRFDIDYSPSHDCTSSQGLRLWIEGLCRTEVGSIIWCGTQCSSFLLICLAQSQRKQANGFVGDESREFVRRGNAQMYVVSLLFFLAWLLKDAAVLEQPTQSVLPLLQPLAAVLEFVSAVRTVTWLGQFGGCSPKPLQLWHTSPSYAALRRTRPDGKMRASLQTLTKRDGQKYSGKAKKMKQSQEYPRSFAEAVAAMTAQSRSLAPTQGQHKAVRDGAV